MQKTFILSTLLSVGIFLGVTNNALGLVTPVNNTGEIKNVTTDPRDLDIFKIAEVLKIADERAKQGPCENIYPHHICDFMDLLEKYLVHGDTETMYQIQKRADQLQHGYCPTIHIIIENAKVSPDNVTVRVQGAFCTPYRELRFFPFKRIANLKAHDVLEKHDKVFRNMPGFWSLHTQ